MDTEKITQGIIELDLMDTLEIKGVLTTEQCINAKNKISTGIRTHLAGELN